MRRIPPLAIRRGPAVLLFSALPAVLALACATSEPIQGLDPPSVVSVSLTPPVVTVQVDQSVPFSIFAHLTNGDSSAVAASAAQWTATGGVVSAEGIYTAGNTPGSFQVMAVETGGTLADTASVTITSGPPVLSAVVLTPATASLQTGAAQQFSASGRLSDGSTSTVTVTYTATGGTITTGGRYTAGSTAGAFRVIATQQGGTLADTAAVTVTAPVPVATVSVSPASTSVVAGGTQQLTATLRDAAGNTLTGRTISWSSSNAAVATVSTGGLVSAIAAGSATVTATSESQQGSAAATVTAAPPPSALWPNQPAGWRVVTVKSMTNNSAGVGDSGSGVWTQNTSYAPLPTIVTDETGEPASPPTAARFRAGPNTSSGAFGQYYVTDASPANEAYVAFTFRTSANYVGHSQVNAKLVWLVANGGYSPVFKMPYGTYMTGPWEWNLTAEVFNVGATNYFSGVNFQPGQWYKVEMYSKSGSNGIYRVWINGVQVINATGLNNINAPIVEVDLLPYYGGVGGTNGANGNQDFFFGHFRWLKP